MKIIDLFWQSNDDWCEIRNHVIVLKDDAPQEAKESYERYLKQTEEEDQYVGADSVDPGWCKPQPMVVFFSIRICSRFRSPERQLIDHSVSVGCKGVF